LNKLRSLTPSKADLLVQNYYSHLHYHLKTS
jgi:hypothetical protein